MSTTYKQPGKVIDYKNATGDMIPVNAVVYIGDLPGIAQTNILDGETGAVEVEGVQRLKKAASLVIAQGDKLFWDTTGKQITKTITDKPLGIAWSAAASSDASADVKLMDVAAVLQAAQFDKGAFVAQNATADGSDAATTQALANSLKGTLNNLLTSLKNAGIIASS